MKPASSTTEMSGPEAATTRHEIKLPADRAALHEVQMWLRLHPAGFSESYPQRSINNIYFDTAELASLEANLAGISERRKLRLRWYGERSEIVGGTWELKCKSAGIGWKERQPMGRRIALTAVSWRDILAELFDGASGDIGLRLRQSGHPTLINSYERQYFESWDRVIRATIDFRQVFFDQRLSGRPNLSRPAPSTEGITVEIKVAPAHYDRLVQAVERLPARVAKTSKYVNGIMHGSLA
jgi:hypothetical protein